MAARNKQISGARIRFENLTKSFDTTTAVDNFTFHISEGEFITLLGPSGSGKTTILNMLAGFIEPSSGSIFVNDQSIEAIPPFKRNIGMVFQSYALFPHMTVFENIAFPLVTRRLPADQIRQRVQEALSLVKLSDYGYRYPKQISGGQQQRIALARAIVFRPHVLLMDEPLGALDKKLREHMQLEIIHLHEALGFTVIYVTHDQSEALTMSDRIVLLNHGRIEQIGAPDDLYDRPANQFVADFIGETNLIYGMVQGTMGEIIVIRTEKGAQLQVLPLTNMECPRVGISIRPEKIFVDQKLGQRDNSFSGILLETIYVGETTKLKILLEGTEETLLLKLQNRSGLTRFEKGKQLIIGWNYDAMTIFPILNGT